MFNRGAFIIPRALCSSDSSNMVPFAAVECDGPFVPCCFYPIDSTYNVISTGGQIFDDIELEGHQLLKRMYSVFGELPTPR
mmetsp:Transcript_23678/g.35181  ORF Transcript_23678/g.35181 Transcript_23678/m.35181 type:complete len:81 (-) Transcript_23678:40-282(-)